jgi:N-acyl-D-glutamate deacylase
MAPSADEIVFKNGRVIDPETRLDAVRNVRIKGGRIDALSEKPLRGDLFIDAKGLVVAPGFVDWHAHGQDILSDRIRAFDGVTTSNWKWEYCRSAGGMTFKPPPGGC